MTKDELKEYLLQSGIPIFENDKVSKKDLLSLQAKPTGLNIDGIQYLGIDKDIDTYTYKFRISFANSNKEKIEGVFALHKNLCENLVDLLKSKLGCVKLVGCELKSANEKFAWVNIVVTIDVEQKIPAAVFDPIITRWFEKIN